MIGDDGKEEFVEAQQLVMVEIASLAPALAGAQRDFDGLEQAAEAHLELLGGAFHLRAGQAVHGGLADQQVERGSEGGECEQDEQADTQYQTVGKARLSEGNAVQHSSSLAW